MPPFIVRYRNAVRSAAITALMMLHAACGGEENPVDPPPPPDAGIAGVSNANAIVCARDAAGTEWCTRANAAGSFEITRSDVAPGTGTGTLPAQGVFLVYTVDCRTRGRSVDRSGPQRNGGSWLDVRCAPDGCMAAPSGLLAWYTFDETAGDTAADLAAAPATARLFGTAHAPGRVLGGLEVLGDGYAQAPADRNLGTGDFSISLWIRVQADLAYGFYSILDKREPSPIRGYHLVLSGGEPLIQLADAGEYGGWYNYHSEIYGRFMDGEWHHLAVTVQRASAEGVRWYVDGQPAGVVGDPRGRPGSLDSTVPLLIGSHSFYGTTGVGGTLDELMIVKRVLSPAEIASLQSRHACR